MLFAYSRNCSHLKHVNNYFNPLLLQSFITAHSVIWSSSFNAAATDDTRPMTHDCLINLKFKYFPTLSSWRVSLQCGFPYMCHSVVIQSGVFLTNCAAETKSHVTNNVFLPRESCTTNSVGLVWTFLNRSDIKPNTAPEWSIATLCPISKLLSYYRIAWRNIGDLCPHCIH